MKRYYVNKLEGARSQSPVSTGLLCLHIALWKLNLTKRDVLREPKNGEQGDSVNLRTIGSDISRSVNTPYLASNSVLNHTTNGSCNKLVLPVLNRAQYRHVYSLRGNGRRNRFTRILRTGVPVGIWRYQVIASRALCQWWYTNSDKLHTT